METIFHEAIEAGSLKNYIKEKNDGVLLHSIDGLENLFPEPTLVSELEVIENNKFDIISLLDVYRKLPYGRIKNKLFWFDTDPDNPQGVFGYNKGDLKKEQIVALSERETYPQTVYKKQGLDRDDSIDMSMDIVPFFWQEMRKNILQTIAENTIVNIPTSGVLPDKIRPISTDDPMYTKQVTLAAGTKMIDAIALVRKSIKHIRTSGPLVMVIPEAVADEWCLIKDITGKYVMGADMRYEDLRVLFGVSRLIIWKNESVFTDDILIFDSSAYVLGTPKGGELASFEDFDIDYNKFKYLMETRVTGSLIKPHCAVHINLNGLLP